jgi:hypothetical protein
MLGRPLRWLGNDGGFGATVTVASVRAERSVREKARWLRCDGEGGFGATVTVASLRAERSVREKARWLGVGWARAGRERKRGGSGCWGWLGMVRKRAESEKRESRDA